jgi:hypothetical protein
MTQTFSSDINKLAVKLNHAYHVHCAVMYSFCVNKIGCFFALLCTLHFQRIVHVALLKGSE